MPLSPDEVAFKRRQLASLREAHHDPAPHVADAIARLEAETAEGIAQEDQLAAAQAIIAGLEAKLSTAEADRAALRVMVADLREQMGAKSKVPAKRKR